MTRSSGYSEGELLKMQEDALARVRQMQQRARLTFNEGQGQDPQPEPELVQPEVLPPSEVPNHPPHRSGGLQSLLPGLGNLGGLLGGSGSSPISSLLSASGSSPVSSLLNWAGGDRIIILVLMVILLGDEGDQTLLLALCYLLLFD